MKQPGTLQRTASAQPHAARRALVIDDDGTYRTLIRTVLESLGWEADEAWDGHIGWQLFQLSDYDIVVLDIFMPYQDGLATIRRMRAHSPAVPILAISGGGIMGLEGYLEVAQRLGANLSLNKPFLPAAFIETMQRLGIA